MFVLIKLLKVLLLSGKYMIVCGVNYMKLTPYVYKLVTYFVFPGYLGRYGGRDSQATHTKEFHG